MSRKTQLDKAIEDQKRNVQRAIDGYAGYSLLVQNRILNALKQAKRDKDRLAHFCSPYYNLSGFGESVSEWRKAVDWSIKAMRQSI